MELFSILQAGSFHFASRLSFLLMLAWGTQAFGIHVLSTSDLVNLFELGPAQAVWSYVDEGGADA